MPPAFEVFTAFLRLGLSSFGGPVAHLGYFRTEFVSRRAWLTDTAYADLVALCQVLPGPASSQVGMGLGLLRAGGWGLLAAWLGFTLPSAALMLAFALGLTQIGSMSGGWLTGLKVAALAVVAQALIGMWRSLITGPLHAALALGTAAVLLAVPGWAAVQVGALLLCALLGWRLLESSGTAAPLPIHVPRRVGVAALLSIGGLLALLPLLAGLHPALALADAFTRAGALVFGGGHVVLPLLEAATSPRWLSHDTFMAGYGAAQAVPGPLFTFASFLGAAGSSGLSPVLGALIATVSIFLPAALILVGVLPFWTALMLRPGARGALDGLNAGVVGLLLAAFYSPVLTSVAVRGSARPVALALLAYAALSLGRVAPWLVVVGCALVGWAAL
ncbi:chromate efflux transporter [Deinococcus sp.]|uniref:chromate efflux transporter n=1 Tax=Deinococcus sp. TaxID=47478 RepID=UPI0025F9ED78|nr:chromate efflux transporter [Deinococcus sp.]